MADFEQSKSKVETRTAYMVSQLLKTILSLVTMFFSDPNHLLHLLFLSTDHCGKNDNLVGFVCCRFTSTAGQPFTQHLGEHLIDGVQEHSAQSCADN